MGNDIAILLLDHNKNQGTEYLPGYSVVGPYLSLFQIDNLPWRWRVLVRS